LLLEESGFTLWELHLGNFCWVSCDWVGPVSLFSKALDVPRTTSFGRFGRSRFSCFLFWSLPFLRPLSVGLFPGGSFFSRPASFCGV